MTLVESLSSSETVIYHLLFDLIIGGQTCEGVVGVNVPRDDTICRKIAKVGGGMSVVQGIWRCAVIRCSRIETDKTTGACRNLVSILPDLGDNLHNGRAIFETSSR